MRRVPGTASCPKTSGYKSRRRRRRSGRRSAFPIPQPYTFADGQKLLVTRPSGQYNIDIVNAIITGSRMVKIHYRTSSPLLLRPEPIISMTDDALDLAATIRALASSRRNNALAIRSRTFVVVCRAPPTETGPNEQDRGTQKV